MNDSQQIKELKTLYNMNESYGIFKLITTITNINPTPFIIILIWLYICIMYLIKIEGNTIEHWEKDMCSTKYVFFSGLFKNKGDPIGESIKNFKTCVLRHEETNTSSTNPPKFKNRNINKPAEGFILFFLAVLVLIILMYMISSTRSTWFRFFILAYLFIFIIILLSVNYKQKPKTYKFNSKNPKNIL